jgi:transcription antitermination protein NusB
MSVEDHQPETAPNRQGLPVRRLAREWALQQLYRLDVGDADVPDASPVWDQAAEHCGYSLSIRDRRKIVRLADSLVRGVCVHREEIDGLLAEQARNWRLPRMAVIDRNLMRIAVYEMLYCPDVPPPVSINEAIEIANAFSGEEAGSFVNGILDKLREKLADAAGSGSD